MQFVRILFPSTTFFFVIVYLIFLYHLLWLFTFLLNLEFITWSRDFSYNRNFERRWKWYRDHRNFKSKWLDAGYWELQNKSKFIKIGLQEAEIALRVGKILIMCIMERSILEEVFMSEFWINFLVIPRSDYLKLMIKLLLLCKKVKSSIESQNVKFGDLTRSQQQNGSKGWWGKWRHIKD